MFHSINCFTVQLLLHMILGQYLLMDYAVNNYDFLSCFEYDFYLSCLLSTASVSVHVNVNEGLQETIWLCYLMLINNVVSLFTGIL